MRKTLMALILVLPMVFVLVIFSSVNLVSLGVKIAVNGIKILAEGADEGTLFVDMADGQRHVVSAEVSPDNATEQGYTLVSSDESVVSVASDGGLVTKKEGTAVITATSNDMSFTDTLSVVVASSKPYDLAFSAYDGEDEIALTPTEEGFAGELPSTGTYRYGVQIEPKLFTDYTIEEGSGTVAEIDKGARTVFFPFSGKASLKVTVPGSVGDLSKTVEFDVKKPASRTGILVNGYPNGGVFSLANGASSARLYIESRSRPMSLVSDYAEASPATQLGEGRYLMEVRIREGFSGDSIDGNVVFEDKKTVPIGFTFEDFVFRIASDLEVKENGKGEMAATVLTGNSVSFYPVATMGAGDVTYRWELEGAPENAISVTAEGCVVTPQEDGDYTLWARAMRGEEQLALEKVVITAISKVSAIRILNDTKTDLAATYTIAGMVYADDLSLTENVYPLKVYSFSAENGQTSLRPGGKELDYSVSDESVAIVEPRGDSFVLIPKGTGNVVLDVSWKGNDLFHTDVRTELAVAVVHDAVGVKNAPELTKAVKEKRPVVLLADISLGTDKDGVPIPIAERAAMLGRTKSTYNIAWYQNSASASDALTSYVLEFQNDVYGNGKSIDADNFTHVLDTTSNPQSRLEIGGKRVYNGPLFFVKYQDVASVAGQDNCAFLVRTDGIRLYGVNLLGCADSSLLSEKGEYDLSNLNLTGTTLEINASCEIVNCRIRNGRNVVRAYGGNRSGDKYFLDDLSQNEGAEKERIDVKIEGCILSQGREFLLKIGANRALRASKAKGAAPALVGADGLPYPETDRSNRYGDLYKDAWFYKQYVMTDVTLKDCVLETSGLFTVGLESNFAGEFLFDGATDHELRNFTKEWERSGGTSFASVLRLEGDVRLYDWKDLALVDSSTLIESPLKNGVWSDWMKLDIQKMIDLVSGKEYENLIETTSEGKQYVHGGIALYGGGRNYSAVDLSGLETSLRDFTHLNINISALKESSDATLQKQGKFLPRAAGLYDFNFYMYASDSENNYLKQLSDETLSRKYKGVTHLPLIFGE